MIGCASKSQVRLEGSPLVPAAEGTARYTTDTNKNTELNVSVRHLAPPEKVALGATAFVVWARPLQEGSPPQNIGALKVNAALEGNLETVTPLADFDLLITPEPGPAAQQPSSQPILRTRIQRR
jgi:hypothetical protein